MEDLIVKLLKENGRLILPDFGAFIVKNKSPFKAIFNEFLQYNDGALISGTEAIYKVNREEAAEKVKEYIDELISLLDNGSAINFPEVGILSKSSAGKIILSASEEDISKETTSAPAGNVAPTVEFDTTAKNTAQEKQKSSTDSKEEGKPEIKEEKSAELTPEPVQKETETKKIIPPAEKKIEKPVESRSEEPIPQTMPISEYYDEGSSRSKLSFILWVVLIVLVNGAIISYVFFDEEIKAFFGSKDQDLTDQSIISTPSIEEDASYAEEVIPIQSAVATTPSDKIMVEEKNEEAPVSDYKGKQIYGKKYYVVAGAFRIESNADKLVQQLRRDGFNAEKFGRIGSLYAVSYDVFSTKAEADKLMFKIKYETDLEAWIRIVR